MDRLLKRITPAVTLPLISVASYWLELNGQWTGAQLFTALGIGAITGMVIHMYAPVAHKVKRGTMVWSFGLLLVILLCTAGGLLNVYLGQAWGKPVFVFFLLLPSFHMFFQRIYKRPKGSLAWTL